MGTRPLVNVVRFNGGIGRLGPLSRGLTLADMAPVLERAFSGRNLKAVALVINSPGGSAVQSSLIARRIRALADDRDVPVVAFVEDVAASGGYWLACAADEIYADENSIVGSIGVIFANFGFPQLLDRLGIERRLHSSGPQKGMLDPFRPEVPEDVRRLKEIQGRILDNFRGYVRRRRGRRLTGPEDEIFSGAFWTAETARAMGLVDGIGDLYGVTRDRFGPRVRHRVLNRGRRGWRRLWLGRGRLDERLAGGFGELTVDGLGGAPGEALGGAVIEGGLAALGERLLWARFGL